MQRILEQAPGLARVHILNFQTTDEGSEARLNFFFYKKDTEEAERNSSLTVSEALTRWFELEWVKENYEAASKFGTPKVMAVEDLKAEEIVKEALKQGQEEVQDSVSSSRSSSEIKSEEEQEVAQESQVVDAPKTEQEPEGPVETQKIEEVAKEPESTQEQQQQEDSASADVNTKSLSASSVSMSSKSSKKSSRLSFLKRDWLACCGTKNTEKSPEGAPEEIAPVKASEDKPEEKSEESKEGLEAEEPKKTSFLKKDWLACCGGSTKEQAVEDIEKPEEKLEEKPEEKTDETKQIIIAEECSEQQEQEDNVQDELQEEEHIEKVEEKPADDINSEPESMGCCGLRKRRKSENKQEEPTLEELKPEAKVTCCGMKKSHTDVDDILKSSEEISEATEPQKLEPIKEESTTGSEQLKRDSVPEYQEVKEGETK